MFSKRELLEALDADRTFDELYNEHTKLYYNYKLFIAENTINYRLIPNLSETTFSTNTVEIIVNQFYAYFNIMFKDDDKLTLKEAVKFINYFLYLLLLQKTIVHELLDPKTKVATLEGKGESFSIPPGAWFQVCFDKQSIILKTFIRRKSDLKKIAFGFKLYASTANKFDMDDTVAFCVFGPEDTTTYYTAPIIPEHITKSFIEGILVNFI